MRKLITIFLFAICSVAQAQDTYLCIPKSATGYSYEKSTKSWEITSFNVRNEKYLLKKKSGIWSWDEFGQNTSLSECKELITKINCRLAGELIFDKKTLRYLRTYIAGYVDGVNNNNNTPLIEIGTCSPL
jgi:hypothetical protein